MLDTALDFMGKVTFVTGPGKHCGKTTFMNRAAGIARRGAREAGRPGPALITVGYDGEQREYVAGVRKPSVPVEAGDIVVTTERFASPCSPEILEVVPGSTALGRLCVARAGRAATVALVGPEGNALVAWAVEKIIAGGMSDTVFVDGAINRMTQVASIPGARFVYALRIDKAGLDQGVSRVRRIVKLVRLPPAGDAEPATEAIDGKTRARQETFLVSDALTSSTAAMVPRNARTVVVADFTKIFLADAELAAFGKEHLLKVQRCLGFAGFIVVCRGITDLEFLERLGDDSIAPMLAFNPYEVVPGNVA
jgi:hypothetical protein